MPQASPEAEVSAESVRAPLSSPVLGSRQCPGCGADVVAWHRKRQRLDRRARDQRIRPLLERVEEMVRAVREGLVTFVAYPGVTGGDGVYAGKVEPLYDDAAVLFSAISADQPVITADPANTGIGAVVDPNAPATAAPSASDAQTAPDASAATGDIAAADGSATTQGAGVAKSPTALPQSITGQTAAEYTCSKGNDY